MKKKEKALGRKAAPKPGNHHLAAALLVLAVSAALFFTILNSDSSAFLKFVLAAGVLVGSGLAVTRLLRLEGYVGLYLLRSKFGLGAIDDIAHRHPRMWQTFAELGMIVGFGSFAYFLIGRKKLNWRRELPLYAAGTFLLVLLSGLIPVAMSVLLSMVTGGAEFSTAGQNIRAQASQFDFIQYLSFAIMVIGGISTMATVSVIGYAGIVASAIISALTGNGAILENTAPGGMPILPGVNLDLWSGIAALALVLIVHEGMHGVLARRHNLPLKSAGLVFFGFLPFGAFVDMDDRKLFSSDKHKQNAVLVAGTAANFATALILLALIILFSLLVPGPTSQLPDWARTTARFLALAFALNMTVAAVNLIPLPLFDGHHIMKNLVGNKTVATAITYIVGLAFLLTLFPWVLR